MPDVHTSTRSIKILCAADFVLPHLLPQTRSLDVSQVNVGTKLKKVKVEALCCLDFFFFTIQSSFFQKKNHSVNVYNYVKIQSVRSEAAVRFELIKHPEAGGDIRAQSVQMWCEWENNHRRWALKFNLSSPLEPF